MVQIATIDARITDLANHITGLEKKFDLLQI